MSSGSTQPFRVSGTATVTAGAASVAAPLVGRGEAALITNAASGIAFIRFGTDATVTATLADLPIPPGTRALLHVGTWAGYVAVVLSGGSGAVYVTRGDGTVY